MATLNELGRNSASITYGPGSNGNEMWPTLALFDQWVRNDTLQGVATASGTTVTGVGSIYGTQVRAGDIVMMAVPSNNGTDFVNDIDAESWSGRNDVAAPYTKEEADMLAMAYKAVGSKHWDLNKGDMDSEEHPAVNIISPIKNFKGYQ